MTHRLKYYLNRSQPVCDDFRAIITAKIDGVRLLDNGPVTIKAKN